MKDIKLMKWDNCYTFVLKMKSIFSDYTSTDSCEFVNNYPLLDIPLSMVEEGDIIVWVSTESDNAHSSARRLYKGIPLTDKVTYHKYHFGIYLDGLVYDLYYENEVNFIRVRLPSMINPKPDKHVIRVIRL